ncbi:MAG TPA: GMP synthase subunit A [Thermoplasmataceae archaeon]|nr:GMP synthase subunit A [Thermoplasmataceae archaeon]
MKVYVIDNGGQWTHREYRVLRDMGVEASILPNTSPSNLLDDADGIVLSGGAPSIVDELHKLGNIKQYVEDHEFPILGICVGAQFLALNFGGRVGPGAHPEFGKTEVTIKVQSGIFSALPGRIIAWENHNDEVKEVPLSDFIVTASSQTCPIQGFQHRTRPIFAVQFHPEVDHTQFGGKIFENFLGYCRK